MCATCIWAVACGALLAVAGPAGGDDQSEAMAIIQKAIKAKGGERVLAKRRAFSCKEKGTYYGMGEGVPYQAKFAVQAPAKSRMEVEGAFTIVFDGTRGWIKGENGTREMTEGEVAEEKENQYALWIEWLTAIKDPGLKLSPLGEAKVSGRPTLGVRVSSKGHRDIRLFFDKETALLLKSTRRVKSQEQGGKEVTQVVLFREYKEVGGEKMPTKVVIRRDGKKYVEAEMLDLKLAEKLDDSLFAKP